MLRVQLIDDDLVTQLRVTEYLRAAGLKVQAATDAHSALIQMKQTRPDVLVLDPVVAGSRALVAHCRRAAGFQTTPLLLISGEPNLGQAVEALGARAGFAKSLDLDVLLAVLTHLAACGALARTHRRSAAASSMLAFHVLAGGQSGTMLSAPPSAAKSMPAVTLDRSPTGWRPTPARAREACRGDGRRVAQARRAPRSRWPAARRWSRPRRRL